MLMTLGSTQVLRSLLLVVLCVQNVLPCYSEDYADISDEHANGTMFDYKLVYFFSYLDMYSQHNTCTWSALNLIVDSFEEFVPTKEWLKVETGK